MTPTSTRATSDPRSGLTLIELSLVLLIVGILLTLLVPRLPSLGRGRLEAGADHIATLMTYLADESALRGRIYRLSLDLDAGDWTVEVLAPFAPQQPAGDRSPTDPAPAEFKTAWDPYGRDGALPEDVHFDSVETAGDSRSAGEQAVYFLPEGVPEDVTVTLVSDDGTDRVVRLDAGTGRAAVVDPDEDEEERGQ